MSLLELYLFKYFLQAVGVNQAASLQLLVCELLKENKEVKCLRAIRSKAPFLKRLQGRGDCGGSVMVWGLEWRRMDPSERLDDESRAVGEALIYVKEVLSDVALP